MTKVLANLLTKVLRGAATVVCLPHPMVAQNDQVNLEEGLLTQLEDAYPTAYR